MLKNKILAFLLALVISIGLWVYAVTVVNPDDTINVRSIKVRYDGVTELESRGLMLVGGDNFRVNVKLSGKRSDLKKLNNSTLTAVCNVSRITEESLTDGEAEVSWSLEYPETVAAGDIRILNRSSAKLSLPISRIKEKPEVPVSLEYEGVFPDGVTIDEDAVVLSPATLSVKGPEAVVEQIDHAVVRLDLKDYSDLDEITDTRILEPRLKYHMIDADGNEIPLDGYTTVSAESIETTIPIVLCETVKVELKFKDGGGATAADVDYSFSTPSSYQVAGSAAALAALPRKDGQAYHEIEIDLADVSEDVVYELPAFTPELPGGVTFLKDTVSVSATVKLNALSRKTVTIPTSAILREDDRQDLALQSGQTIKVTLRGHASQLKQFTASDIKASVNLRDFTLSQTGENTVELKFVLPNGAQVGVVGGPYRVTVIDSKDEVITKEFTFSETEIQRQDYLSRYRLKKQTVTITVKGVRSAIEALTKEQFTVAVDLSKDYDANEPERGATLTVLVDDLDVVVTGGPYTVQVERNG